MSTAQEKLARLRRFNNWVSRNDAELAEETADLREEVSEAAPSDETIDSAIELESIALRRQRPVLSILNNETSLVFVDPADSEIWESRLTKAKPLLDMTIPAVGRIELEGGRLDWVGTGWLVADGILVTNRHVANEFAMRKGEGFTFRMGNEQPIAAAVDFLQEFENPSTLLFKLVKPLYIEDDRGPDLAFFEIDVNGGDARLAKAIQLADDVVETENVATIGYPAYDSRIPEPDLMERIYGRMYNKKRLAPGGVTRVEKARLLHNCTTLGGNSGSVVFDLDNGHALGLHFSGTFLDDELCGARRRREEDTRERSLRPSAARGIAAQNLASSLRGAERDVRRGRAAARRGEHHHSADRDHLRGKPGRDCTAPATVPPPPREGGDDDVEIAEEAVAADYSDREGYDSDFLGKKSSSSRPSSATP